MSLLCNAGRNMGKLLLPAAGAAGAAAVGQPVVVRQWCVQL